ncbi:hypothetical protein LXL04_002244 [Taraxacum kok-saghyz]
MDELNSNGGGGVSENDEVLGVTRRKRAGTRKELGAVAVIGKGKPLIVVMCGTLVYYHCAYRNSSIISLISDVFIVLLCSLAILGLLFRQMNIQVPVDPLEWQISPDTANSLFACLANTVGAAESVLRVAATGHDKRLFLKVVVILYMLSALGRLVSGVTVAYTGLCLFSMILIGGGTLNGPNQRSTSQGENKDTPYTIDQHIWLLWYIYAIQKCLYKGMEADKSIPFHTPVMDILWMRECLESFKTMGHIQYQQWNKWVPKKHNIFIWRLSKDRIPTRRKLNDMGMYIPCTLCPLCGDCEEDSTHLFFECSKTARAWQKFGDWWSLDVPLLRDVEDLYNWSWITQSNEKNLLKFQAAFSALLVTIWRTRNGVVFENKKVGVELDFRSV